MSPSPSAHSSTPSGTPDPSDGSGERAGLAKTTARGATWNAAETLLRLVLRVVVLAALARLLTPEDFGVFAAATIVFEFARPFATLSIDHSLVQRPQLDDADVGAGLSLVTAGGLVACLALLGLAPFARYVFDESAVSQVILALAPLLIASGFADVGLALLKRNLAFRTLSVIGFVGGAVANGGCALFLAWLGWGHWALVGGFTADVAVRLSLGVGVVWRHHRPTVGRPTRVAAKRLLRFGVGRSLAQLFSFLALHGDYLVIGGALGTAALGIYTRSYQLVSVAPGVFAAVSGKVLFPVFSKLSTDRHALQTAARAGLRLTAVLGMPSAAILGVLAPESVDLLLGPGWEDAILPLQVMSAGVFLRTGMSLAGAVAMATARVYALAFRQLVYGAVVLGGGTVAVRFGIGGVAASTVIAMCIFYLLMTDLLRSATHLRWRHILEELGGGLMLATAGGGAALGATLGARALELSSVATLGLGGGSGVLAGAFTILAFGKQVLGHDLHRRFAKVLSRRRPKP